MTCITTDPTGLQADLLALLPKDGARVTVTRLARETGVSAYQVTSALFAPYLAHEVDFDIRADAYSRPPLPRTIKNAQERFTH